jgi:hypothetical protein
MGSGADCSLKRRGVLAFGLALLAACAPPGDKFAAPPAPAAEALVGTFLSLCGTLEDGAVAAAAGAQGFLPQTPPAEAKPLEPEARVWLRQTGHARAMLRWSPGAGECSLAASASDPAAVAAALQAEETRVAGDRVALDAALPNGTRIAIAYRTPAQPPQRLVFMGVQERPERRPLVVLVARAEPATPPAPKPGPPKR